jgi:hypothetical protein
MGRWNERQIVVKSLGKTFLIVVFLFLSACSAQNRMDDDFLVDGKDPFEDEFFADSPQWDSSVLQQSEVLSSPEALKESDEPKTFVEKSEEALFGAVLVGGMVAKMFFLPFLGL